MSVSRPSRRNLFVCICIMSYVFFCKLKILIYIYKKKFNYTFHHLNLPGEILKKLTVVQSNTSTEVIMENMYHVWHACFQLLSSLSCMFIHPSPSRSISPRTLSLCTSLTPFLSLFLFLSEQLHTGIHGAEILVVLKCHSLGWRRPFLELTQCQETEVILNFAYTSITRVFVCVCRMQRDSCLVLYDKSKLLLQKGDPAAHSNKWSNKNTVPPPSKNMQQ